MEPMEAACSSGIEMHSRNFGVTTLDETVRVRPYEAADWPHLCKIHDPARRDELKRTVGVTAFLSLEETFQDEGLFDDQLLIAEIGNTVVGFVAFTSGEVTWLYVDPAFYRIGIGRILLRSAIALGGGKMEIELLDGNTPALELYRSEGFDVVARREGNLVGNEAFKARGLLLRNY